ncbi:hypothetical protein PRIPAC_97146 [Pristionchus pacificus]|uniref:Uncharacterized protein n=1 Tax=Pristionchus pacificus TaxID=54126 RepID=A0A2A6BDD7_PRIPA|nr:hypothetical protein PRIPAC_97146 [Pristionchus pacificus]|eukprot:PDM63851.1 hypothetical protein PRIPAC_49824 [Pristionchus pacificus]
MKLDDLRNNGSGGIQEFSIHSYLLRTPLCASSRMFSKWTIIVIILLIHLNCVKLAGAACTESNDLRTPSPALRRIMYNNVNSRMSRDVEKQLGSSQMIQTDREES